MDQKAIDKLLEEMYPDTDFGQYPDLREQIVKALEEGKAPEEETDSDVPPEDRVPVDTNKLLGQMNSTLGRVGQTGCGGCCGQSDAPSWQPPQRCSGSPEEDSPMAALVREMTGAERVFEIGKPGTPGKFNLVQRPDGKLDIEPGE